jgi:myo-inositol 2-dehydrogenase/D-chiro-inositol 1-dehydrogenase
MVKLALLGAGRIGQVHARAISMIADAKLKYVFDPMLEAANFIVDRYGAIAASMDEILGDPEVQAVLICTPSDQHADQIQRAVIAGKAVFCEKPISTNVDTTRETLRVVDENQGCLMLGFKRRF